MKAHNKTRILTESALLVALATVLSMLRLVDLPYGGSVTLASMLPVVILAYRHGTAWGLLGGAANAVLQLLLGLNNLTWFSTWQSVVAVIVLDYLLAFTLTGFGGLFRRAVRRQHVALALGAVLASLLRYVCHVIAGATVWAGLSIPTEAALLYSLAYNATYMLPECIVTALVALLLGTLLDFRRDVPTRLVREGVSPETGRKKAFAWIFLLAGLITDTALLFPHLQNAETGEFDLAGLAVPFAEGPFLAILVVSIVAAIAATILFLAARREEN